jgi:5,10-methylenetetrahydrofolate reductase
MVITDVERIKTFNKRCGATLPDKIIQRFEKGVLWLRRPRRSV